MTDANPYRPPESVRPQETVAEEPDSQPESHKVRVAKPAVGCFILTATITIAIFAFLLVRLAFS